MSQTIRHIGFHLQQRIVLSPLHCLYQGVSKLFCQKAHKRSHNSSRSAHLNVMWLFRDILHSTNSMNVSQKYYSSIIDKMASRIGWNYFVGQIWPSGLSLKTPGLYELDRQSQPIVKDVTVGSCMITLFLRMICCWLHTLDRTFFTTTMVQPNHVIKMSQERCGESPVDYALIAVKRSTKDQVVWLHFWPDLDTSCWGARKKHKKLLQLRRYFEIPQRRCPVTFPTEKRV